MTTTKMARIQARVAKLPAETSDTARIEGATLRQVLGDLRDLSAEVTRLNERIRLMELARKAMNHGNPLQDLMGSVFGPRL